MLGLLFENCNEFGLAISFDKCNLNHSSFFQTKIKRTAFKESQLQEVDFSQCDLAGSVFDNCDLLSAKFENSILEKVDFRTAFNYSIDPSLNKIKKARFSTLGVAGLLDKYDIEIEG
jgi:fluoroquinolone resistance protein